MVLDKRGKMADSRVSGQQIGGFRFCRTIVRRVWDSLRARAPPTSGVHRAGGAGRLYERTAMAGKERIIGASEEAKVSAAPGGRVAGAGGGGGLPERGWGGRTRWGSGARLYVLVVGVVGAGMALRWMLDPLFGQAKEFMTFYPAVVVAALIGGARAGVMATVLSALVADLLFFEPRGSVLAAGPGDWVALGLFAAAGGLISWMAERVERAREREWRLSEREKAAKEVRKSEERYRSLFENMLDGYAYCRMIYEKGSPSDFLYLDVNGAFERLTGLKDVVGRKVSEVIPGMQESNPELLRIYGRVALTGQPERFEIYLKLLGIWLSVSVYSPEKGHFVAVFDNITERKRAEAVLARSKVELEGLVAERTAKLQEMVEELEHFSYTITHDLKAPLRAMRGFAEIAGMLCGDCARKEAKEALGKISTSAERMECLITDALSYSRLVRQELPLRDVDTGALLRGMLESYPELQPSRADIQVEGELPVVLGSEAGLTQCFSNLLGNAVKFVLPEERPEIRVWAEERGDWARIWVEDKGIGVSKEMLPRVFDMFSRGGGGYEGTGIGLALVRKMTERMGGRAGVESEEGKGSRFWMELRLGEMRVKPAKVGVGPAEPRGGTVLYVEDEESDALFMKRAFAGKGLGSALRVVGDGRAAIEYLSGAGEYGDRKEYPLPSVVLLDLNLPQVAGFEVLRWMRNHPDYAKTPVVVFSSSTREDDRVKALELGANEFVGKPNSGLKFGEVVEGLRERWMGFEKGDLDEA